MAISKGFLNTAGIARESAYGTPVVVGALQGLEYISESIAAKAELIEDAQITGNPARLNADKGNEFHAGDLSTDFAYDGLEVITALGFGQAGAPAQLGADTAYKHVIRPANDVEGLFGTLVLWNQGIDVREYVSCKVNSVEFSIKQGDRLKVTYNVVAKLMNRNTSQLSTPAAPTVTNIGAAGAVTHSYRIVARSLTGQTLPGTAGTTATGNASLSASNFNRVTWTAVTGAFSYDVYGRTSGTELFMGNVVGGLAFDDKGTVTPVGALPGANTTAVNSTTTAASITYAANRNFALWSQMQMRLNAQGGAALAAGDKQFISEISWKLENHLATDDVTTQSGIFIDEPVRDNFLDVTGSIKFTKYNSNNVFIWDAIRSKAAQKMDIVFTGPNIVGGSYYGLSAYFPSIQFTDGTPNIGGPGRVPLDVNFVGHRVAAVPTGFPSGYIQPLVMELVSVRSTDALV